MASDSSPDSRSGDSLYRLFQSSVFDGHLHMFYLQKTASTSRAAHDYLVNLLYRNMDEQDLDFYLPQLVTLSLAYEDFSELSEYLLNKAAGNMSVALKIPSAIVFTTLGKSLSSMLGLYTLTQSATFNLSATSN